jgi:tetratricopeptide (TPR) repeat protein
MQIKQIVAIVAVVVVMGYLYVQPVKGLVKQESSHDGGPQAAPGQTEQPAKPVVNVDVEKVSTPAKTAVGASLSDKIISLEASLAKASSPAERQRYQLELAHEWDGVNQPAPAAFYYQMLAKANNKFEDWMATGNRFNDAYKFTQDTTVQPAFVQNAIAAFKKAQALKPDNLVAQTGLGVAYVNQTSLGMTDPEGGSPMQGITLLLNVVAKDPDNWNANLNLGQFAMKSGQFQKAADRFKKMIALNTDKSKVEPYFYLAESYKQLGQKQEAIAAYQKCKELMADPAMGQTIDNYIKELKN